MKKILSIALPSLLLLTSCDLDINVDPNNPGPSDVTTDLILPAAENFIADCVGDQMFNYAGFFAQYFEQMPTANQYNDYAELNVDEGKDVFFAPYRLLFAGALMDLKEITDRSASTKDLYVCAVLRAYTYQIIVDNIGTAPYKEALAGVANTRPMWDDGQTIYEGVLAEMDEAEKNIVSSDKITLTDPMLDKDIDLWVGFANAIRLRMLFRLVDGGINVAENTSKIKKLVADNVFFTKDVLWDEYMDTKGQYNPWYASFNELGAKNHCAAYPIVSYLSETSDPRISYAILPRSKDNKYVGQLPGSKTTSPDWYGLSTNDYQDDMVSNIDYKIFKSSPIYLYTQSELKFLIAEAELRFNNNSAAAKDAYEAAVRCDFISRGIEGADDFLATSGKWKGTNEANLNLIYMQKWVALFMRDHMEAWTEARRTDVPALSNMSAKEIIDDPAKYTPGDFVLPAINLKGNGKLPMSMPIPISVRVLNSNTPISHSVSDKVFWDVK